MFRPSSQQLADDISEKAGKEDVCSVIVPAGEDGYARRPTSVKAMDSNYINVEGIDDFIIVQLIVSQGNVRHLCQIL